MKQEKILKWRLSEKPSVEALKTLVDSGILKQEEARQILLDETEYNSKDFDDVLAEIKLLRELVLTLAAKQPVQEIIRIIDRPVYFEKKNNDWLNPYIMMCANQAVNTTSSIQSLDMSSKMNSSMNNALDGTGQFVVAWNSDNNLKA